MGYMKGSIELNKAIFLHWHNTAGHIWMVFSFFSCTKKNLWETFPLTSHTADHFSSLLLWLTRLFWANEGVCSCLHNCSHQQMKRVSWTSSTTWLSRWAMSNLNLSKLASSAPTSFLQHTPPSVLLVKSIFPQIFSFSFFPLSPNLQLQQFQPPSSVTQLI